MTAGKKQPSKRKPPPAAVAKPSARERFADAAARQYTPEIAESILCGLMSGKSLSHICREPGMPSRVVVGNWILKNINGFAVSYARARIVGLEARADEIIDIADDCGLTVEEIAKAKLQVDARKWCYARMASSLRLNAPLDPEDDLSPDDVPEIESIARKMLFIMNKSIAEKNAAPLLRHEDALVTVGGQE